MTWFSNPALIFRPTFASWIAKQRAHCPHMLLHFWWYIFYKDWGFHYCLVFTILSLWVKMTAISVSERLSSYNGRLKFVRAEHSATAEGENWASLLDQTWSNWIKMNQIGINLIRMKLVQTKESTEIYLLELTPL